MIRVIRPWFEDRHPAAESIARELAAVPALLGLRTRRLAADVMHVRRCSESTARRAVAMARKAVRA